MNTDPLFKIDLCKDLPDTECEIMNLDLDEAAMVMLKRVSDLTGKTQEQVLEDALLSFIETLQQDYVAEL